MDYVTLLEHLGAAHILPRSSMLRAARSRLLAQSRLAQSSSSAARAAAVAHLSRPAPSPAGPELSSRDGGGARRLQYSSSAAGAMGGAGSKKEAAEEVCTLPQTVRCAGS